MSAMTEPQEWTVMKADGSKVRQHVEAPGVVVTAPEPVPTPQPWPELHFPTAREFVDWFMAATDDERLEVGERLASNAYQAQTCFMANHVSRLEWAERIAFDHVLAVQASMEAEAKEESRG